MPDYRMFGFSFNPPFGKPANNLKFEKMKKMPEAFGAGAENDCGGAKRCNIWRMNQAAAGKKRLNGVILCKEHGFFPRRWQLIAVFSV